MDDDKLVIGPFGIWFTRPLSKLECFRKWAWRRVGHSRIGFKNWIGVQWDVGRLPFHWTQFHFWIADHCWSFCKTSGWLKPYAKKNGTYRRWHLDMYYRITELEKARLDYYERTI